MRLMIFARKAAAVALVDVTFLEKTRMDLAFLEWKSWMQQSKRKKKTYLAALMVGKIANLTRITTCFLIIVMVVDAYRDITAGLEELGLLLTLVSSTVRDLVNISD